MLNSLGRISEFVFRKYTPLNTITISSANLKNNYRYLLGINPDINVAPVLKSNAYGHGIVETAKILDKLNPPFICVDSLFEGYQLLNAKIKSKILIMGYIYPDSLKTKRLPFSFSVYTMEQIEAINRYQPDASIHIFVDTGMHREGVRLNLLDQLTTYLKENTNLKISGLMSHLAMSEKPGDIQTRKQLNNFTAAQKILAQRDIKPRWVHICNSSGLINSRLFGGNIGNIARAGIALYGIDPEGKDVNLHPVLSFKTKIGQIKEVEKGGRVGYGFSYLARKKIRAAILPVGYFDGIERKLSNRGYVKIGSDYCPIIGKVSMNITTIDITRHKKAKINEEVTVFSDNIADKNTVYLSAKICRLLPYELLVRLSVFTKRIVI